MRVVTIRHAADATPADAREHLGAVFPDAGRFLVTDPAGTRREIAFESDPRAHADPLSIFHGIFPGDGDYQVREGAPFAKAVHVTEPFAEWFLEQLLEEARQHFGRVQDVVLRVMDRLIRERRGHLTDPAVLAEFEQARTLLRQGVRWALGAPVPAGVEATLKRLGFQDVDVLDWPGIAYRMGAIRGELEAPKVRDWQRVMAVAMGGPVTPVDRAAMAAARERVARYLTPLALRAGETMHETVLAREVQQLRTMTVQAIAADTHPLTLARQMHKQFGQDGITRDWERVARTEVMEARLVGGFEAERAAKAWTDGSKIWRQVSPTACSGCLRLYRSPDGTPKLYTVAEVEAADALGVNRGPWREWHARKGPAHPNCRDGPWQTWTPALATVFARHAARYRDVMAERGLDDEASSM